MKKKKNSHKASGHEVYIAKYKGEILYVGEGTKGRNIHVNSGCSNVYGLNYLHNKGYKFDVDAEPVENKELAELIEIELIDTFKPAFNRLGTDFDQDRIKLRRLFNPIPANFDWSFARSELLVLKTYMTTGTTYMCKDMIRNCTGAINSPYPSRLHRTSAGKSLFNVSNTQFPCVHQVTIKELDSQATKRNIVELVELSVSKWKRFYEQS